MNIDMARAIPFRSPSRGAYLKEIRVYNKNTKREYFAAAIKNEEGGYDYRNLYFKGCVKKKAISFIRGSVPKPEGINLFERFIDFLSVISRQGGERFKGDTVILIPFPVCEKHPAIFEVTNMKRRIRGWTMMRPDKRQRQHFLSSWRMRRSAISL